MNRSSAIDAADLPDRAAALLSAGQRLALVAAHHDPDAIRVVYAFTAPGSTTELQVRLDTDRPVIPSLAALSYPAGRFEREMHDLYGVTPTGHPQPRRLVRHHHWPQGWYPMRHDAGDPPPFGDPLGPFPFLTVEGPGVYEIPVGPVHAGLIEPGHFRFSAVGESILKLKARLWFVHRGIEKLFEGRYPGDAVELAERISGDTAVGHTLAFCQAVEQATGCDVPPEARPMRGVLLELERIYNHVNDLGALCNDVGYGILHTHAQRIREQLLRVNADVTGHRLLRGGVIPGGAQLRTLPDPDRLAALGQDAADVAALALAHTTVLDRFTDTAVLTPGQARDLGTLGYVARASGLPTDTRREHPTCDLGPAFRIATRTTGDVLARFQVRAEEIATSVKIISHLVGDLSPGRVVAQPSGTGGGSGVGLVEGWRGTIAHRVELDETGALTRAKLVDPSFFNWPALPIALNGAIVPDFPLANKSFNLSYAGNDL